MKFRYNIFFVVLLFANITFAQQHDNIWLFGYDSTLDTTDYGGTVMDFNLQPAEIFYQNRDMNFDVTNASICDVTGNLLFYTNGIYIANANHQVMENGMGINPGEYATNHQNYGYILDQGALIIPHPSSDNLYYLFHASKDYPNSQVDWHSPLLYYSLIDMNLDDGLGAVVEKNIVLIDDILASGQITATKHSNGRDWWVLIRKHSSNEFYRLLVTPNGILQMGIQETGALFNNGLGQAVFSPNGSKYIIYNLNSIDEGGILNIYDFDRCTGELSNPIQSFHVDSAYSVGAAISPNSRYLYLSSYNYIYQYDLEANDILASKDTVAIYDGYQVMFSPVFGISTRFYSMQLAPDGRIYINIPGGVNVLHVINNPNEAGIACNLLQHGVELPTYNAFSLPNFPNYRLGVETGSLCDTITSVESKVSIPTLNVKTFPNPVSDYINIQFELQEKVDITIYNLVGQEMFSYTIVNSKSNSKIDVSNFPVGSYFYKIKKDRSIIYQGKFIIQR